MSARGIGPGRAAAVVALPVFVLIAVVGVLPFATAARDSFFHDVWGARSFAGLENYRDLVEDRAFFLSFAISTLWAVLSALFSTTLGCILGIALYESKRTRKVLFLALLVPWGIPAFISVPIWRMLIHGSGGRSFLSALLGFEINLLTDPVAGFAAALAVGVWLGAPLAAFAVYAALSRLPRGVAETAAMDGAGPWTMARWIYFPQIRSSILIMGTLELVKSFKEFTVPFLMTAGGPPFRAGITERHIVGATTTLEIFLYDAFRDLDDYGIPAAYATAVACIVVIATACWLRLRRRADDGRASIGGKAPGAGADIAWRVTKLGASALAVLSAALVLYATAWLSLSDLSAVYIDGFLPRFLSFRPFIAVVRDEDIFRYFLNTLLVAGATALLVPLIVFPAAWLLARSGKDRKAGIFASIEALGMTGGIHSLIPLYAAFRALGLLGGYLPIVVVYLFHALPFALFTIAAHIERLPRSLEEAAALEGMAWPSYMARVLAPLAAPALTAATMTAFISAWNGFLVPLVFLSDDDLYPIGVKLHALVGSVASGNPKWNLFAAASVLNMAFVAMLLHRFKDPLGSRHSGEAEE